jgi:S-methylmethionine-dependent homocysteine/selenocysteine methylase
MSLQETCQLCNDVQDVSANVLQHENAKRKGDTEKSSRRRKLDMFGTRTSASAASWQRWREIEEKFKSGAVAVIDGGTGSEIEKVAGREALSAIGWTCCTNLSHPSAVRTVHRSYLDAGADIIIANTYCTNRHVLEANGKAESTVENNLTAVRLCQEARESYLKDAKAAGNTDLRVPLIAGSISLHAPGNEKEKMEGKVPWPNPVVEMANYLEQATLLLHGGVDMLFLEMVWNLEHGRRLLDAIRSIPEASAVPVFVGLAQFNEALYIEAEDFRSRGAFVMENRVDKPVTENAMLLRDFVAEIAAVPHVVGINIMHTKCHLISPAMKALREGGWTGALGAYPDGGEWLRDGWNSDGLETDLLARHADEWVDEYDARLVGGCCGFGPKHIQTLSKWADGRIRL